jgi:hypothetical protein
MLLLLVLALMEVVNESLSCILGRSNMIFTKFQHL